MALLVVFAPGITFALYQLFMFEGTLRARAWLMAWAFLVVGLACFLGLMFLMARDAVRRIKGRRAA